MCSDKIVRINVSDSKKHEKSTEDSGMGLSIFLETGGGTVSHSW